MCRTQCGVDGKATMALRTALLASMPWHVVVVTVFIIAATCTSAVLTYVIGGSPLKKRTGAGDGVFLTIFLLILFLIVCVDLFCHSHLCTPAFMLTKACVAAWMGCCISILMSKLSVDYENSFDSSELEEFSKKKVSRSVKKKQRHPRKKKPKKVHVKKKRVKKPRRRRHAPVEDSAVSDRVHSDGVVRVRTPRPRRIVIKETVGDAARRTIAHGIVAAATGIAMIVVR